jgi:hypothetical protein
LRETVGDGTVRDMRAVLALMLFCACGPKVAPQAPSFDEDLAGTEVAEPTEQAPAEPQRPEAPPGKGLRTGTIERAKLVAVLDGGPGQFLRQLEVTPRMDGERFVGWQLVQLLDRDGPLVDVDVVPGDVLLAINGKSLTRPDQLQALWDSLRTANEVRAQLWRGDSKLELAFAVEPRIDPAAAKPVQLTKCAPRARPQGRSRTRHRRRARTAGAARPDRRRSTR